MLFVLGRTDICGLACNLTMQFNMGAVIFGLFLTAISINLVGMSLKQKIVWIGMVFLAIGIRIFSRFPEAVEKYYSNGLYPVTARIQRLLFGWVPFSVGDLFYGATAIWLVYGLICLVRRIIRKQADRVYAFGLIRRTVLFLLCLYVIFNLFWGLNYDRKGIAMQLQLEVKPYSTGELTDLVQVIAERLNVLDSASLSRRGELKSKGKLFSGAIQSYGSLAAQDPRFAYPSPSVKPSVFSYLGNYLGFGGYYNPFSGEAQVNTTLPLFTQPYTTCHEIGHQLGYAKENEANFAGYLSARASKDPAFRYSVYFDMYLYAARELYVRDSNLLKPLKAQLKPAIRQDFRELQQFNRKYENPMEPVIQGLYGRYLRANRQAHGIMTYNEVIAWLIAYGKKNGKEAI
jgi:Protein of unknown function (DUF3810)